MKQLLAYLQDHTSEILGDVEQWVRIESPSRDREAMNRLQDLNERSFGSVGHVRRIAGERGDLLRVHVQGTGPGSTLLLAHMDTVYAKGSWERLWRVEADRAYGPGTYDMKAGAVQALWALRALRSLGKTPATNIDLLLTTDEEVGSEASRPLIEEMAQGAKAVLVLEAPYMNGDLKVARKGVGHYVIRVAGRAAHQGLEPENGRNAIVSAARLIQQIVELEDRPNGTTLGPNVIQGGTASNVVADSAMLRVDLRVWSTTEAERVGAAIRKMRPLEGTEYTVEGGLNRPPMEPTEGTLRLLERAQAIAKQLGFEVGAARVGGASDGNLTSHLAPTLDGLGAMGANAHQKDLEFIHIPSLAPRTALLAGMLMAPQ